MNVIHCIDHLVLVITELEWIVTSDRVNFLDLVVCCKRFVLSSLLEMLEAVEVINLKGVSLYTESVSCVSDAPFCFLPVCRHPTPLLLNFFLYSRLFIIPSNVV